jgi:murein L,D-transpeptidase YcbB/YkuD
METMTKPTRKAMREALKDQTIQSILRVPKSTLTAKQAKFAEEVAKGEKHSVAYRKAYNTKAKPKDVANNAHRLAHRTDIASTIKAIQQANEAMKYQNAESLRSLAITSLVQVLTDPETKPQAKIQASKIIGQMTEVSLFTHRSETKVIHSSEDIKAKILQEIRGLMSGDVEDVIEKDATSLLAELTSEPENSDGEDPTGGVDPTLSVDAPHSDLHTIPHERSDQNQLSDNVDSSDPPPLDGEPPR